MRPAYSAKIPISSKLYLADSSYHKIDFDFLRQSLNRHIYKAMKNKADPWHISPNMIPNKNGNEITVKKAGLTYLYLGTP